MLISKRMTSQPVKQTIVIRILTNNSRSHGDIIALYPCKNKGNQTMKFGQLIEYSVSNTFLEMFTQMITQNVVEKLFQDQSKKSKLSISLNQ